jgi:CHRD domain
MNLHTAQFPGGAVRGQLHRLDQAVNLFPLMDVPLAASASGAQEVPGPGDPDGQFVSRVDAAGDGVSFDVSWTNLGTVTMGHIHQGQVGQSGPVVVPLFAAPQGLPDTLFAVSATVTGLDPALVNQIRTQPRDFYLNLHTADVPQGAVRGQIFDRTAPKMHF